MRRFWVSSDQISGDVVTFSDDVFHHLVEVSRFKEGSVVEVLIGGPEALVVKLTDVKNKKAYGRVIDRRKLPEIKRPYIHLALSLPRFQKVDEIIEKSVELGVSAIWPFVSDHSFVRKPGKVPAGKIKRWHNIIRSASEQCGRAALMSLGEVQSLSDVLKGFNQRQEVAGLFPYEGECELKIKPYLQSQKPHSLKEIWLFVGSEGGFSAAEVDLFRSQGLNPVSMGGHILRVESACLALVSILKYEFEID